MQRFQSFLVFSPHHHPFTGVHRWQRAVGTQRRTRAARLSLLAIGEQYAPGNACCSPRGPAGSTRVGCAAKRHGEAFAPCHISRAHAICKHHHFQLPHPQAAGRTGLDAEPPDAQPPDCRMEERLMAVSDAPELPSSVRLAAGKKSDSDGPWRLRLCPCGWVWQAARRRLAAHERRSHRGPQPEPRLLWQVPLTSDRW